VGAAGAGVAAPSYVYAIGRIEARFPRLSVEKEFVQATGRVDTSGLTDRESFHAILSRPENRYLVRQLCWIMSVDGLETYLLHPRDSGAVDLLLDALRVRPSTEDLDVVIGVRGPIAPPELCNGLQIPIVAFDQIYSFDRQSLLKAIPRPANARDDKFDAASEELLDRLLQLTDNAGAADEHRALNYLAMRYHGIYASVAEAFDRNASLTSVDVRPSALAGTRRLLDVVFSYTDRATDVTDKSFVRVDVTDEFPFLVKKLSPYYEH
jgi:hypothetical protein